MVKGKKKKVAIEVGDYVLIEFKTSSKPLIGNVVHKTKDIIVLDSHNHLHEIERNSVTYIKFFKNYGRKKN